MKPQSRPDCYEPDVLFTYDRLRRQVAVIVDGVSTNTYTYDTETLALSVETQNGMEINRTTDLPAPQSFATRQAGALGRDSGFSLGSGYSVQYGYDAYGRLSSLSALASLRETNTFTYSYLPNTDLISGMTASSGFLWTRAYESARSLITSVENRCGEAVISRYDYTNDELGRRTSRADSGLAFAAQPTYGDSATVEMPAYNAYSYNIRSEVTGAARRWGTPGASGDLVLGQQYTYAFDPIGNRITAAEGDTSRTASYTANALNQYTQRTVPDEKDLIGTAPTNVAVTVNQNAASRQNAYWYHALEVTNAASAAYPQVAITAVYNPPGTNDADVVTSQTGHVFVAKTPEQFTYDDDGNLTQDGRFDYTWNGENRLIKAETRDDLPTAVPRVRVEYAYDHQSRRIASATSTWTNDAWQAVESHAFLYDGWNVVTELTHSQTHTLTNSFIWGLDLSGTLQGAGGIGGLLAASLGGTTAFYCHDANGNVGQLTSADGDLFAHYEYSPFGETVVSIGPLAKANPFRFSTKHWDDATGLGYWGYRWYSPGMGRWISRDPIGETVDQALGLYCFINNNCLADVDLFGLLSAKFKEKLKKKLKEWLWNYDPKGYNSVIKQALKEHFEELAAEAILKYGGKANCVRTTSEAKVYRARRHHFYSYYLDVPAPNEPQHVTIVEHFSDLDNTDYLVTVPPIDTCKNSTHCVSIYKLGEGFDISIELDEHGPVVPSSADWILKGLSYELFEREQLHLRLIGNGTVNLLCCSK